MRRTTVYSRGQTITTINLNGLRVLNTRPSHQAKTLSTAIHHAGGISVALPSLIIEPLPDNWVQQLPPLLSVTRVIFVSTNAVHYFFTGLQANRLTWPETVTVIAIGQATANAVKQYHQGPLFQPEIADSEHLLHLDNLQQVTGEILLLITGRNSRPLIATTLRNRGATVHEIAVYRRIPPEKNLDFTHSLWQDDAVDVVLLLSQEATANLLNLFAEEAKAWILSKPCIVISPRLAKAVHAAGFQTVITTTYANLLTTLASMAHMTKDAKKTPPKVDIATTPAPAETPKVTPPKLAFMAIILLLIVVTGAGIIISQSYINDTRKLLVHTQAIQQQQSNKITTFQKALHQVIQTNKTLSEQFEHSEQQISSFLNEHPYQSSDWILQKARYYLELAQINTNWMDNQATSIVLLKQADTILAHTHEPALNPLREAIAENIITLQNAPTIDSQAIIQQLQSVQEQIISLNQASTHQLAASSSPGSQTTLPHTWRDRLFNSLKQLKSLVVVHHYPHDALQAQLMPNATALVLESIRLNLQQAQIALLNHQQTLYTLTLTTIIQNIQNYYDPHTSQAQQIIDTLQKLLTLPVSQTPPVLIDLLTLFDSLTQQPKPLASSPSNEVTQ